MQSKTFLLYALLICSKATRILGFTTKHPCGRTGFCEPLQVKGSSGDEEKLGSTVNRRDLLGRFGSLLAVGTVSFIGYGIGAADATTADQATIWRTGRAPVVPGQKPKDKNDVKGTKKDPDFLRSIADCKNKCESGYGPDGLSRSKEDCLSECQDICCKTYEQCTFSIVPR